MSTITEDIEILLSLEPELAARAALSMHGPELDAQHTRGWAAYVRFADGNIALLSDRLPMGLLKLYGYEDA